MVAQSALTPLDDRQRRRHKLRNALQTMLLLGGMTALLGLCAWLLAGPDGVLWAIIGGLLALSLSPRVSPALVLKMFRAREIPPQSMPQVYDVLDAIAARAKLPHPPRLYYIPSSMLNAFAVGSRDDAVIGVTDGVLRTLKLRELAGVLAHEISHIRNRDLWVMNLADTVSHLTRTMALVGMMMLMVTLPLWLARYGSVPWLAILLLAFAPTVGSLLQLALSRARELDADLDAAGLTGDPRGLASALAKMERCQSGFWERILFPGSRIPDPSVLRTHPPTEERIERLLSLAPGKQVAPFRDADEVLVPKAYPTVVVRPRRRFTGLWY